MTAPQPAAVRVDASIQPVTLGASPLPLLPMAFGGSWYSKGMTDAELTGAMQAAYDGGVRHFDTGARYSGGRSEELLGGFLAGKRDEVFLASKSDTREMTAAAMLAEVEGSLKRLAVDRIDLYYIHWPRAGHDMRPTMEGLALAHRQGKVGAVGVSNFTVPQMQLVAEVAPISAHQLGYNLLWRYAEDEVIPHCQANGVAVVAYSALAHGIMTGKFGPDPRLVEGDQRHTILPFRTDLWPHVHASVGQLKAVAAEAGISLPTLAIRWPLQRPGVSSVVVGARNAEQAAANVAALAPAIAPAGFARATEISAAIAARMPDVGNLFNHYP